MQNRMGLRLAALACITVFAIAVATPGRVIGGEDTPFRFDPMSGWVPLQSVNPYADFTLSDLWDGTAWEGSTAVVRGRATIVPDTGSAQISVDFLPDAGAMLQSGPDLFVVPLHRPLKWKATVIVRNPGDVAMTDVVVSSEFGSAFIVTVDGSSDKRARVVRDDGRGLLPVASTFSWSIEYLGPGEAAKAELTVRPQSSCGGSGFSAEGVYSIHSGFRLTYSVLGQTQVRSTGSHSVIARNDPASFRPDTVELVSSSETGDQDDPDEADGAAGPGAMRPIATPAYFGSATSRAILPQIERLPDPSSPTYPQEQGRFRLLATGLTPNVSVESDKFVVPAGEHAEWDVEMWVLNPGGTDPRGWNGWEVSLTIGRHLEATEAERYVIIESTSVSNTGVLTIATTYPEPGVTVVRVLWDWQQHAANRFLPESTAYIRLRLSTEGLEAGSEDLVFAEDILMKYNPVGDAFFHDVRMHDIYIKRIGGRADITVSATRLDWRVRKPGVYATVATQVSAIGAGTLLIQFSGFDDLVTLDAAPGSIPVWYGFGPDMAAADTGGWVRASDLNNTSRSIDLSNPTPVTMWSKISVGDEVSSAEYGDEGVITFILGNNQPSL